MSPHGLTRYHHGPDEHGNPAKAAVKQCAGRHQRLLRPPLPPGRLRPVGLPPGRGRDTAAAPGAHLQRLAAGALAARYGCTVQAVQKMLTYSRVSPATATAVRALYRELWDQPPPEGTPAERQAAARARNHARRQGWCPPAAWDDDEIDHPAAVPAPGWRRFPVADAIREARERAGLSQYKLAAAVGVSRSAVQNWERATRIPEEPNWVQLELTLGPLGVVRESKDAPREEAADAAA